jgi:hypothetical protein
MAGSPGRRVRVMRGTRLRAWLAAGAVLSGLAGCGDTLQDQPISHSTLETLVMAPRPVYWLGRSFDGLTIKEATRDPGGAFSVQYGDCKVGGQGTCVPPLRIVTSPDNSFLPGSAAEHASLSLRGVSGLSAQSGRTIVLPAGGVVISIYALDRGVAAAAAQAVAPINAPEAPGAALPAPLPDTGFGRTPLPAQVPAPLAPPT